MLVKTRQPGEGQHRRSYDRMAASIFLMPLTWPNGTQSAPERENQSAVRHAAQA
jgi:hypothetical protein